MAEGITVVGGCIASLVAALSAARRGRLVTLYLDPAGIGGSFAGVQAGSRRLDLGSRLFELDYEDVRPRAIQSFDAAVDTHKPFIGAIADFIQEAMAGVLRPAEPPEMWIEGRTTRCPLMTVDLTLLPGALQCSDRAAVVEQVRGLAAPDPCGDRTIHRASLDQHGERLHRLLIEPICAKQHRRWSDVLASERRKLWGALFHPATIVQAFSGSTIAFRPHRPFTTTISGQFHPFVARLWRSLRSCRGVMIVPAGRLTGLSGAPGGKLELRFADGQAATAEPERCAIGASPGEVFAAAGLAWAPERLHASIVWVRVPHGEVRHVPSSLLIADPALAALRVSPAGPNVFAVEFGAATGTLDAAQDALVRTGLVADGARVRQIHAVAGPSQVLPTAASRNGFTAALDALGAAAGSLLGGARRFGFDSLNDQVLAGLHFGATRC